MVHTTKRSNALESYHTLEHNPESTDLIFSYLYANVIFLYFKLENSPHLSTGTVISRMRARKGSSDDADAGDLCAIRRGTRKGEGDVVLIGNGGKV